MRRLIAPLILALAACGPGGDPPDGGPGFDDHTLPRLVDRDAFFANSEPGGFTRVVKFVITDFSGARRQMRYYDSTFFQLHDEWYWFRLMNGERAPGDELTAPFDAGETFDTVEDVVSWARAEAELPLDLAFVGDRLYSPRFYQLALAGQNKAYGVGTVIYAPPRDTPDGPRDEVWAFELEYQDNVSHGELVRFFIDLLATLPADIGSELKWLVRSPAQESLALQMEQGELQFHDRIMRYSELAVAGETEVYSEGLVAGRLRMIRPGEGGLDESRSTDVLVMADIPDYLPPCAALLTAVPQTPLAHINVLARNRGIPNAYIGGVTDDPNLDQLARVRAPAIVLAEGDTVIVLPISEAQFAQYRSLSLPPALGVPPVDLENAPYTIPLEDLDLADVEDLRPLIGGKSAGFLGLQAGEVTMPHAPLAVTARAYAEHVAPLLVDLEAMIEDPDFRDPRVRTLVLEGGDAYGQRFPTTPDAQFAATFLQRGDLLAFLAGQGGVQGIIEDTPIEPATLAILTADLSARYASYDPAQGLRFRSSSSVEDIEGFNGAGLYDSNTGFLDGRDGRTVERAVRRTWSSYWGTEAYDERELSNVDHLSGNMAVLVHARFDDPKELSNAVFTYTLLPGGDREMDMNVQLGELSVTNPPPGSNALPEVDLVREVDGAVTVTRVAGSTEVPAGAVILDDDELESVFTEAGRVVDAWLAQENAGLLTAQRRSTLTLDFELREMDLYWPLLANGNTFPRRLVIKQARSLEPGLARVPVELLAQPLPRDLLARARFVERRDCLSDAFTLTTIEITTDPLKLPDVGHGEDPFTGFVTLELSEDVLGMTAGERFTVVHTAFASQDHPGIEDGPWSLALAVDPARPEAERFTSLSLSTDGSWTMSRDLEEAAGTWSGCQVDILLSTPEELLRSFLP
jgi:hypothetical protein